MGEYYFGVDEGAEERRLRAVEALFDPVSRRVLRHLGVGAGWVCWEVGAGKGSLANWLAELVGAGGHVLATDLDIRGLRPRPNLEVLRHDVVEDDRPDAGFDLIHARFLLEHLPEPDQVMHKLASALNPGGVLVVEDTDSLNLQVDPPVAGVAAVCRAWESAARSIGWDPCLGGRLVADLTSCDLTGVEAVPNRKKAPGGPAFEAVRLGLIRLHDQIVASGVNAAAVAGVVAALDDPAHTITGAPVVTAWGREGR
jgi:SAM-dependent methyltransferase